MPRLGSAQQDGRAAWASRAAMLLLLGASTAAHAQASDVIRGRVTNRDSLAIEGADVVGTGMPSGVRRVARTTPDGRYTLVFPGGDTQWMLLVTSLGYVPRRMEVKRLADEDLLLADVALSRSASVLDAVRVSAARPRAARTDGRDAPGIAGDDRSVRPDAVDPRASGSLDALATSVPGVLAVPGLDGDPGGFSVLGLSPEQNAILMNGNPFGGSVLPRDATVTMSLSTSPYDVSRGGFSGGLLSLRSVPPSSWERRELSLVGEPAALQAANALQRALGQRHDALSLGLAQSGPWQGGDVRLAVAGQLDLDARSLVSLTTSPAEALSAAGVPTDSLTSVADAMRRAGLGTSAPSTVVRPFAASGMVGLYLPGPANGAVTRSVVASAAVRRVPASDASVLATPRSLNDRASEDVDVQVNESRYLHDAILAESSVGLSVSRTRATPLDGLPAATLFVAAADAPGSVTGLSVAGSGSASASTQGALFLSNVTSWISEDGRHRLKASAELKREQGTFERYASPSGTFIYRSIADLADNTPSSFIRELGAGVHDVAQDVLALSLGDAFRPSPDLQLQLGLRLDANRVDRTVAPNAALAERLGLRNDQYPDGLYLSPRLGFSWTRRASGRIEASEGSAVGASSVIRGGIGVFQGLPTVAQVAMVAMNSGTSDATQTLRCVGSAVPVPQWTAYATDERTVPASCRDGAPGASSSRAPSVARFADDWRAPQAVRGTLQWTGTTPAGLQASAEVTESWQRHQSRVVDRNFRPALGFQLRDEADRPVFVTPAQIDASGFVAPTATGVDTAFAHVGERRSDLAGLASQLRVMLASPTGEGRSRFGWSLAYTLSRSMTQVGGFELAGGDPRELAWARSAFDVRHQGWLGLSVDWAQRVQLAWSGRLESGRPFTPLVDGDVNGDGYANDRAFVFDTAATSAEGAGIARLVAEAPGALRSCLLRQLGRIASPNSCDTGWSFQDQLEVTVAPSLVHLSQRARVSLTMTNPLVAVLRRFGVDDEGSGWGGAVLPDERLLVVQGFDAGAQRFRYAVNPQFGRDLRLPGLGAAMPALTLVVRLDVGTPREAQGLRRLLDEGRTRAGSRATETRILGTYGPSSQPNPIGELLRQADSLGLTGPQADSLATMNLTLLTGLDSIWTVAARALAALPDRYDAGAAYRAYREAREGSVDLMLARAPAVLALLTADQRRRLSSTLRQQLDVALLQASRSSTLGDANRGAYGLGGSGGPGGPQIQRSNVFVTRPQ